jgi:hypothetical protein
MMAKRKVYLMIELDAEVTSIPPHLRGLLSRPLVDPLTTRQSADEKAGWMERQTPVALRKKAAEERQARIRAEQRAESTED